MYFRFRITHSSLILLQDDLSTSFGMFACKATFMLEFLLLSIPHVCRHACVLVVLVHLLFVIATGLLCIFLLPVVLSCKFCVDCTVCEK